MKLPRLILEKFAFMFKGKKPKPGIGLKNQYDTAESLIFNHFKTLSHIDHPSRPTMELAISMLDSSEAKIVETGSSAWGTNSSMLFDSYVNSFGGEFLSCDIRVEPMFTLSKLCTNRSKFYCDDSVLFLKKLAGVEFDLVYLDSWDVDWSDPIPSAIHGFHEFLAIYPSLKKGGLLLIDDTPKEDNILANISHSDVERVKIFYSIYGFMPGKGALIKNYLEKNAIGTLVAHDYQLLWKF